MLALARYTILVLVSLLAFSIQASAQTTAVRVQWDPNPAADNVLNYTLTIDSAAPINVALTSCTATVCEVPQTVSNGSHTFTIAAVNQWGSSSTTISQVISPPLPPKNFRIIKSALLALFRHDGALASRR